MTRNRLEAFSDGVIAIIITIMVLELRPPSGSGWQDLMADHLPAKFFAYVLSFIYLGIYWNNHHHLMHLVDRVNGAIMWANIHLLFWLSIVPFSTAWMGEFHADTPPAALYAVSLLMPAIAYSFLVRAIIGEQLRHSGGQHSKARDAFQGDLKGNISTGLYVAAVGLAFVNVWMTYTLCAAVAVIWLVPDRRVSRQLNHD